MFIHHAAGRVMSFDVTRENQHKKKKESAAAAAAAVNQKGIGYYVTANRCSSRRNIVIRRGRNRPRRPARLWLRINATADATGSGEGSWLSYAG